MRHSPSSHTTAKNLFIPMKTCVIYYFQIEHYIVCVVSEERVHDSCECPELLNHGDYLAVGINTAGPEPLKSRSHR